jgi:hypothetical protein
VLEDSVVLPLADVERFAISGVDQAVDIPFQPLCYLRREFVRLHSSPTSTAYMPALAVIAATARRASGYVTEDIIIYKRAPTGRLSLITSIEVTGEGLCPGGCALDLLT